MDQHVDDLPCLTTATHERGYDLDLAGLLMRVSRISAHLDSSVQPEWIVKKVQFLTYELSPLVHGLESTRARLELLNQFFFMQKHFRPVSQIRAHHESLFLLHQVLASRSGDPSILALLYAWLAESIGVHLQFVDLHPTCFLKFVDDGKSSFIDLAKNGEILDCDGLLEHINERYKSQDLRVSALLETVSASGFMLEYLGGLRHEFLGREQIEDLLFIQNALIECQPANLKLLGERSLLHFKLGHYKHALSDLKRYFAFTEREKSPSALVQIYDDLISLTKRPPPPQ